MKIEFPNSPRRGLQWSTLALVTIGVGMLLFVAYGAGNIPTSIALFIIGPIGIFLVLMAVRRLRGKQPSQPRWIAIAVLALIIEFYFFLHSNDAPTWTYLVILACLFAYSWFKEKRKIR